MQDILAKFSNLRILVIGDLMLDHYLWGDATRISPEAPVPVVKVSNDTYTAGGAANVASNLRALGCKVELVGTFGADEGAECLLKILKEREILLANGLGDVGRRTIEKTRVMCRNQQLCRIDREDAPIKYALLEEFVSGALAEKIREADAVIISDYAKGVVTSELIARIREIAGKDKLVALDPKPRAGLEFTDMSIITPNKQEALALSGLNYIAGAEFPLEEVCRILHERFKTRLLVITLGEGGMLLSREGKVLCHIPTAARAVFDVSGAGDTVVSALTAALAAGAEPALAAKIANHAAGVVVEKLGTATATREEILKHVES